MFQRGSDESGRFKLSQTYFGIGMDVTSDTGEQCLKRRASVLIEIQCERVQRPFFFNGISYTLHRIDESDQKMNTRSQQTIILGRFANIRWIGE